MCWTVPLVAKPRFSWLAGWRLPLPETVDWTTPLVAVAVRVTVEEPALAGPTRMIAAAVALLSVVAAEFQLRGNRPRRHEYPGGDRRQGQAGPRVGARTDADERR